MSYYKEKVSAMQEIRETIGNNSDQGLNTNIKALALKILNKYGFSIKFTPAYIKEIVSIGNYEYTGRTGQEVRERKPSNPPEAEE